MRITRDQALNVSKRILFGACRSRGGLDHLSNDDSEIDKPGHRAVPNILKLTPQHVLYLHGQIRMLALQRLHASQFIHADRAFALFGTLGCPGIDPTALNDFLFPLLVGNFCQPISEAVRLQFPFLSRLEACRGEICSTMPLAFSSSAISLPVHWLIGRPAFAGASHAIAAI
jgi:hypothetical protein